MNVCARAKECFWNLQTGTAFPQNNENNRTWKANGARWVVSFLLSFEGQNVCGKCMHTYYIIYVICLYLPIVSTGYLRHMLLIQFHFSECILVHVSTVRLVQIANFLHKHLNNIMIFPKRTHFLKLISDGFHFLNAQVNYRLISFIRVWSEFSFFKLILQLELIHSRNNFTTFNRYFREKRTKVVSIPLRFY